MKIWNHKNFIINEYEKIPSTNDLAFELASNNQINHNQVILAHSQENGHGRYGRNWQSQEGNLYFSLMLRIDQKIKDPSLLSFVSAVVLSKTIDDGNLKISHKWPNDILIDEKKVAGILLKTSNQNNRTDFVIIGIGLNVNNHPENTIFEATNLKFQNFKQLEISEILKNFLDNFSDSYEEFLQFGFTPIRNLWLKKAFKLNKSITANLENQKVTGIFKDLNNDGNLILKDQNNHTKIISSGEIFN